VQIVGRFLHVDEASAAPQYSPGAVGAVLVGRARLAEPSTATLALRRRRRRRTGLQRATPLPVRTRAGVVILLSRLAGFAHRGGASSGGARHRAVDARAGVAPIGRWIVWPVVQMEPARRVPGASLGRTSHPSDDPIRIILRCVTGAWITFPASQADTIAARWSTPSPHRLSPRLFWTDYPHRCT
jgi:hypothetical protein